MVAGEWSVARSGRRTPAESEQMCSYLAGTMPEFLIWRSRHEEVWFCCEYSLPLNFVPDIVLWSLAY
jgi:hypothetical protein